MAGALGSAECGSTVGTSRSSARSSVRSARALCGATLKLSRREPLVNLSALVGRGLDGRTGRAPRRGLGSEVPGGIGYGTAISDCT